MRLVVLCRGMPPGCGQRMLGGALFVLLALWVVRVGGVGLGVPWVIVERLSHSSPLCASILLDVQESDEDFV